MPRFHRFAVADWSGAKGSRHAGIALAICEEGQEAPKLITPPDHRYWSRIGILQWLEQQSDNLLIGFDFSFAPPLVQRGAYLPGDAVPDTARAFHAYVDTVCADEDLGAASFLEEHHRRHFYLGKVDGEKARFMHLRQCEIRYNEAGGGKPSSIYDAIGAAQVAKSSFSGMRLLARLSDHISIWPFDPVPTHGPVVVEIYTSLAARAAGMRKGLSKIRTAEALDAALACFDSQAHKPLQHYSDHATDAIMTAAWLRKSAENANFWQPEALFPHIAATEGWTFGVV